MALKKVNQKDKNKSKATTGDAQKKKTKLKKVKISEMKNISGGARNCWNNRLDSE